MQHPQHFELVKAQSVTRLTIKILFIRVSQRLTLNSRPDSQNTACPEKISYLIQFRHKLLLCHLYKVLQLYGSHQR